MERELTKEQEHCLALMRDRGMDFIAGATERHWRNGTSYYIDSRVNAKGICRLFAKCNKQATGQ